MIDSVSICSERLVLRPWAPDDAGDLYEYAQSDLVGPNAGWKPHISIEESAATIRNLLMKPGIFAVSLKDGGKVIGSVGLHSSEVSKSDPGINALEVGYVLSPNFWGHGYIPEAVVAVSDYAFQRYGLDGLYCGYFDFNYRSMRVNQKCGFRQLYAVTTTVPAFDNVQYNEVINYISRAEFYQHNPSYTDFLRNQ